MGRILTFLRTTRPDRNTAHYVVRNHPKFINDSKPHRHAAAFACPTPAIPLAILEIET
jgi:hypothetical protein